MPWTGTHGLRLAGWRKDQVLTRLYLAMQYYHLLPKVREWKRDYRDNRPEELAAWMQKQDPLPGWLSRARLCPTGRARVPRGARRAVQVARGYVLFARRLLTQEPSDTTLYLLGRRHGYRPSTVKRYITRVNREADQLVRAARAAEKAPHP